MGKKRRVRSKLDELPNEVRYVVDSMLANMTYTYTDISDYLKEQGFDISRGAVFRYAQRTNNAAQRVIEAQAQTRALVEAIRENPNMDYTEGTLQIIASGLTSKLASAQEEWEDMAVKDAANLMISLSRAKGYKDKVYSELTERVRLALDAFKKQIFEEISDKDKRLADRLMFFAEDFADSITKEQ